MTKYTPLLHDQEKNDGLETQAEPVERSRLARILTPNQRTIDLWSNLSSLLWLLQVLLLLCSATMLYVASSRLQVAEKNCLSHVSTWSPGLQAVEYQNLVFRGSLYHHSAWKGTPRPELDALWHRVGQVGSVSVTANEVRRLGKDPDYAIKWPDEYGGGHVASIEVFHHLHCLNFLRKSTYREYYNDIEISFTESESDIRRHQDHCIDMLRQAIMCTGDVGLLTYNWVKDNPTPFPDFDTRHRCRNFSKLLEWGESTAVKANSTDVFEFNNRLGVKLLDGDD